MSRIFRGKKDVNRAIVDNTNPHEVGVDKWGVCTGVYDGTKVVPKDVESGVAEMGSFLTSKFCGKVPRWSVKKIEKKMY